MRVIKENNNMNIFLFLHLFRGHKEIDNFLKTYFPDINDQKIIDITKNKSVYIVNELSKLHSYIDDDKNIKNVNYGIMDYLKPI